MSVCLLTVSLFLYERRRGGGGMYVPRPQFRILQRDGLGIVSLCLGGGVLCLFVMTYPPNLGSCRVMVELSC